MGFTPFHPFKQEETPCLLLNTFKDLHVEMSMRRPCTTSCSNLHLAEKQQVNHGVQTKYYISSATGNQIKG